MYTCACTAIRLLQGRPLFACPPGPGFLTDPGAVCAPTQRGWDVHDKRTSSGRPCRRAAHNTHAAPLCGAASERLHPRAGAWGGPARRTLLPLRVCVCRRLARPAPPLRPCRRSLDLGQFERFRRVMHSPYYATLLDHSAYEVLGTLEVRAAHARACRRTLTPVCVWSGRTNQCQRWHAAAAAAAAAALGVLKHAAPAVAPCMPAGAGRPVGCAAERA